MDSYSTVLDVCPQPSISIACPAKALEPAQRQGLAVEVLAGTRPVSEIARQEGVSRKFLYQQAVKAEEALQDAFAPKEPDQEEVLFCLPVTKAWIEQLVLGLALCCHSSVRGATELLSSVFDYTISVGKVHGILHRAMLQARDYNTQLDLSGVRIGAHDELFQNGKPVLVGADVDSTYCYLLSLEDQRDGDTWGIRLLELRDRGFDPEATIADAGSGLRAGQAEALPNTSCRGDVFHALKTVQPMVTFLENRAYEAIAVRTKLEGQRDKKRAQGLRTGSLSVRWGQARQKEAKAIALAEEVATLADWLREDILSLAGPDCTTRCELYDFVTAELRARESLCPHRIRPVVRALENQRDDLLAFAAQLDQDLAELAREFQCPVPTLRGLFHLQILDVRDPKRWSREGEFRRQLGRQFDLVSEALADLARLTTRASSVIENFNSRLRGYFFLRRHLGTDYLALLQFFLNHRRFPRSQRPERVGKSPTELLTQKTHPHWLEMLGYTRFSRN